MNDAEEPDDLDRRVDERLRGAFAPPALDAMVARVAQASAAAPPRRRSLVPRAALLALAAAAIVAAVLSMERFVGEAPRTPSAQDLAREWTAAFHDVASRAPGEMDCCSGPVDVPSACMAMCAARLAFESTPGLSMVGTYDGMKSAACLALVLEGKGGRCCVFVLPRDRDPGVRITGDDGLWLHRRDVGSLSVYELGRSREPRALDRFVAP